MPTAFERSDHDLELVSINDLADTKSNALLFQYDSTHGRFPGTVEVGDHHLPPERAVGLHQRTALGDARIGDADLHRAAFGGGAGGTGPQKTVALERDHAEEQNKPLPPRPMLFSKASTCLQAPGMAIELPEELTQVDAEGELAVIISKPGRSISRDQAAQHIAGYTCFNDVSDRDAQYSDRQYFRGKSIDTGGPCGPWLGTPDELPPLAAGLAIEGRLNGAVMQRSDTSRMIFPVDELISYASSHMTLMPGDIIATGTPEQLAGAPGSGP